MDLVPAQIFDQRAEPRLAPRADCTAQLSVLNGYEKSAPATVQVLNFSGRGLRLRSEHRLAPGTLVRMDLNQTILLGEVCYTEPDGENFALGLRLEHSLLQTESLERLRQRFAEEVALDERVALDPRVALSR